LGIGFGRVYEVIGEPMREPRAAETRGLSAGSLWEPPRRISPPGGPAQSGGGA
jgi:hypothetical protein